MYTETFTYEEDNIVLERNHITDQEAMQLAALGFIHKAGQTWYRRCRYDSVISAQNSLKPGEIIVEHRTAVFILTTNQNEAKSIHPALVFSDSKRKV